MVGKTKSNVPSVFGTLSQASSTKVSGNRTGARACSEPIVCSTKQKGLGTSKQELQFRSFARSFHVFRHPPQARNPTGRTGNREVGGRYRCRRDYPALIDNRLSVLQITNPTANMPGEDNNNIPSANIITDVVPSLSTTSSLPSASGLPSPTNVYGQSSLTVPGPGPIPPSPARSPTL